MATLARFWRAETGIFVGIWLGLMICGRSQLFSDPGAFWHIAVGERLLSTCELIHTDPFSFTCAGQPWIAQWWLADCLLALIHRIDRQDSTLLVIVSLLAALYTWVAHRLLRVGIHWLVTVFIVALAIAASAFHFHPRPHLVTIAFLGWTFARLCDFEAGRSQLKSLFWLVPLFVLWTNMHGGVVGGVGTIAACVCGWSVARLMGLESPIVQFNQIIALALLVAGCGLTALVNPYGTELPRVWFSLMGSPVLPQLIIEHVPLRLSDLSGWIVLGLGFIYVLALVGVSRQVLRPSWLIPLLWLYLAWTRIRHGPIFAITAAIALAEMFPHVRWVSWLTRHGSDLLRLQPRAPRGKFDFGPAAIPVAIVVSSLVFQVTATPVPVMGHGWAKLDPTHWPVELLPRIREYEQSRPDGTPIFNDMLFGGFLIYYTPGLRVFIDDRCELYGDKRLLEYSRALSREPEAVDRWAREYDFDMALTIPGTRLDSYLRQSAGWSTVQETTAATLFCKIVDAERDRGASGTKEPFVEPN